MRRVVGPGRADHAAGLVAGQPVEVAVAVGVGQRLQRVYAAGQAAYGPNKLAGNMPSQVPPSRGGYASYPERVSGQKVRQRSTTFSDHYGQARLFWDSMSPIEREHITKALQFELSKVTVRDVRVRMLAHLHQINTTLAAQVALELGEPTHAGHATATPNGTADSTAQTAVLAHATSKTSASGGLQRTKGLSLEEGQPRTPKGHKVAILAADSVNGEQVQTLLRMLKDTGSQGVVVGPHLMALGSGVEATMTLANTSSVLFDAVYVPGGAASVKALLQKGDAHVFIDEAYKHGKPIAAVGEGMELITASEIGQLLRATGPLATLEQGGAQAPAAEVQSLSEVGRVHSATQGGVTAQSLAPYGIIMGPGGDLQRVNRELLAALAHHRFWGRPRLGLVPA